MSTGRYDLQLAPALEKLEALRAEEARLWLEVKASGRAIDILLAKWENASSALYKEQEHQDALALIAQFEAGLEDKCSAT